MLDEESLEKENDQQNISKNQESKQADAIENQNKNNTQFPDILQFLPNEEMKKQCELYANNDEMINKKGLLGYSALHWACIRNDLDLIKYLVIDCKAYVDIKGNLGESPLFICIK